ncbi:MAG: IPT/TIG domain-containing protein, partial [Candidatus Fonsibacter sp.]
MAGITEAFEELQLRPQITDVFPRYGSTFGGTYLVIAGSGFSLPSQANPWDSQSVFVGAVPCSIVAHYTTAERIVCITGPAPTPFANSLGLRVSARIFAYLGQSAIAYKDNAFTYVRGLDGHAR